MLRVAAALADTTTAAAIHSSDGVVLAILGAVGLEAAEVPVLPSILQLLGLTTAERADAVPDMEPGILPGTARSLALAASLSQSAQGMPPSIRAA